MEKREEKHFVLVHGACHGAWCWYKVATLLRAAGHRVTALDMAASGVHPKRLDQLRLVSDHYEPLRELLDSLPVLPEERVILVGHSKGGATISVAMERFPQKIAVAVFVAAIMPGPSLTVHTLNEEFFRRIDSNMDNQFGFDDDPHNPPTSILFGPDFLSSKLYHLSPPEDLTLAKMLVRPERLYGAEVAEEMALTEEKYGSVRRVFVVCEEDKVLKEDFQRWMIQKNPPEEVEDISGSDHMVMLSNPAHLCSSLLGIAERFY